MGAAEAIELARTLGRLPRRLVVYGIEGASFHPGAPLTPAVADAVKMAAGMVRAEIVDAGDVIEREGT
jgi:hydrogenase maturation protease